MALQIHTPYSLANKPYHLLVPSRNLKFSIKSKNPQIETDSTKDPASPKKASSPGLGFGSSSPSPSPSSFPSPSSSPSPSPSSSPSPSPSSPSKKPNSRALSGNKKQKGKRERASVIRRAPVEKPAFVSREEAAKAEEQRKNENAFLLTWLGLGAIILVEGIVLAASGFLPEELDKFFVKYLYPAFTPTVGLFVAGTVAYGVLKYIQNEKLKSQK